MLVKDLTIEELKLLIQETVAETIQSLLIDPDEGRQVKPEVKQQLLNSLHRTQAGERGISALGSCKEIGLELVMTYYVEFTSEVTDDLEQLTSTVQQRILSKIRWLSENLDNLTPQTLSADLSGLFKRESWGLSNHLLV